MSLYRPSSEDNIDCLNLETSYFENANNELISMCGGGAMRPLVGATDAA